MSIFSRAAEKLKTDGSAFAKAAIHDAQVLEAKGKIAALDAKQELDEKIVTALEDEVTRIHEAREYLRDRVEKVLSDL